MIKIGIVGAGAIGIHHQKAIVKNPECKLAAVCDLDIKKAEDLVKDTDARTYTDYRQMQENENLDAVILNLPHFLHKDVSIYFLKRHIAVLVEKPMANNVSECDAMIEVSKETGTPFGVGHVQKYYECYIKLREIIEKGELGRFCHMTETRNIDYFTNRPTWFLDKEKAGGGIVMNYAAHTLDKLFFVLELDVESVAAIGNNFYTDNDIEASAQILLKLSDGSSAALTYCGCKVPSQYETCFYFTNGVAKITATKLYVSYDSGEFEEVNLDYEKEVFETQLAEFVKLIKGKENQLVTPEYGRRVIDVICKAFEQFIC